MSGDASARGTHCESRVCPDEALESNSNPCDISKLKGNDIMRRFIAMVATIILTLALATVVLAADPFVGTWKLNIAKSKASDSSAMVKSETVKTVSVDNGLKSIIDGVDLESKAYHFESSLIFDGKDYPVKDNPGVDMRSAKKTDANTFWVVNKKARKEVERMQITVSKDGKTQNVTGNGMTDKGKAFNYTWIYNKQ